MPTRCDASQQNLSLRTEVDKVSVAWFLVLPLTKTIRQDRARNNLYQCNKPPSSHLQQPTPTDKDLLLSLTALSFSTNNISKRIGHAPVTKDGLLQYSLISNFTNITMVRRRRTKTNAKSYNNVTLKTRRHGRLNKQQRRNATVQLIRFILHNNRR